MHIDIDDLRHTAQQLLHPLGDLAPSSRVSITNVMSLWQRFADHVGLPDDIAQVGPDGLAAFALARLMTVQRATTVDSDIWALCRAVHAVTGTYPHIDLTARAVVRGYRKERPSAPVRQAAVMPLWFLGEMVVAIRDDEPGYARNGDWRATRDRAVIGITYGGALRPNSLEHLDLADIQRTRHGYRVLLRVNKGSQPSPNGWRDEEVLVEPLDGSLDPVALLDEWLTVRGREPGALFPIGPTDIDFAVTARTIRGRLCEIASRCGDHQERFALSSLRRSWATHAFLSGTSVADISAHLLHTDTHVTDRYISELRAFVGADDARRFYLSTVRPADAGYNFAGGLRRGGGFTPWEPPDVTYDELLKEARRLARAGLTRYVDTTVKYAENTFKRWAEFASTFSIDPVAPDPEDVAAFAVYEHRRPLLLDPAVVGCRATTVRDYIADLTAWWAINRPLEIPPLSRARAVCIALLRAEGTAPLRQASVPDDGEVALSRILAAIDHCDEHLNIAVLRWHSARAGVRLIRPGKRSGSPLPWRQLTRDNVTATDTHVTFTVNGTEVRLNADEDPVRCPVRAVRSLLRKSPTNQLLDQVTFGGNGTMLRRCLGLTSKVETWTEDEFHAATSWLAAELRRSYRDRAAVTVMYAGALRGADVRAADISDLERYEFGYVLSLRFSKENQRGEPETVALLQRDDDLCPVAALDDWLAVWPHDSGPLLPGRCGDRSYLDGSEPETISRGALAHVVEILARRAGVDITGHSFRRLAATLLYAETEDIDAVRRLLRHRRSSYTERYIEQITPRVDAVKARTAAEVQQ